MIALHPMEKFTRFLLVPFPPSCPFCIPAGPNEIVQVKARAPMGFAFDPVLMRGTLILHDDASSMFYDLDDAEKVTE
jgi:hypothetical protein